MSNNPDITAIFDDKELISDDTLYRYALFDMLEKNDYFNDIFNKLVESIKKGFKLGVVFDYSEYWNNEHLKERLCCLKKYEMIIFLWKDLVVFGLWNGFIKIYNLGQVWFNGIPKFLKIFDSILTLFYQMVIWKNYRIYDIDKPATINLDMIKLGNEREAWSEMLLMRDIFTSEDKQIEELRTKGWHENVTMTCYKWTYLKWTMKQILLEELLKIFNVKDFDGVIRKQQRLIKQKKY